MDEVKPGARGAQTVHGTAAFSKSVSVLQLIADDPGRFTVAQLTKAAKLPRATTHRIVAGLLNEGFIAEDARTGCLELGPRLISLAARSWDRFSLRILASDDLRALRDATGETVHLAVPGGREMVYIDKVESPKAVRMTSVIGARIPLYSTAVGKAYLAALDQRRRDDLLAGLDLPALTPGTITDRAALEADIAATAERGYSVDSEETEPDIICFGCVVRSAGGPVGAVSITIPKYRLSDEVATTCREGVIDCARRISARASAIVTP